MQSVGIHPQCVGQCKHGPMHPDLDTASDVSLREAAELLGVSVDTLKRRQKDNKLPEATLIEGARGSEWRIPTAQLPGIADRESWTLNLDSTPAGGRAVGELLDEIRVQVGAEADARVGAAEAKAVAAAEAEAKGAAQLKRAQGDADAARAETERIRTDVDRVTQDLAESNTKAAVAEAKVEAVGAERDRLVGESDRLRSELAYERLGWISKRRARKAAGGVHPALQ